MQLSLLPQVVSAFRDGRIGDAAVLKAVALSPASYGEVERAVVRMETPLPDLYALTQDLNPMPGTLGWHYSQFIHLNDIEPLRPSPEAARRLRPTNLLVARYVLLHDVFHVLLGFDISRCGELAVWSFVAAQRYNVAYAWAAMIATWIYPLIEPQSFRQLALSRMRGLLLGSEVPCLITQPIEKFWAVPLEEVRVQFGILNVAD
ncbi:MAG: Coq4 family protein [Oceanococcus sp.]